MGNDWTCLDPLTLLHCSSLLFPLFFKHDQLLPMIRTLSRDVNECALLRPCILLAAVIYAEPCQIVQVTRPLALQPGDCRCYTWEVNKNRNSRRSRFTIGFDIKVTTYGLRCIILYLYLGAFTPRFYLCWHIIFRFIFHLQNGSDLLHQSPAPRSQIEHPRPRASSQRGGLEVVESGAPILTKTESRRED